MDEMARCDVSRERGASVVAVLVLLVILGGLSVVALAALPSDPSTPTDALDGGTAGGGLPGGAGTDAAPGHRRSPAAGALAAACTATARTIGAAAATKHAADGAFPATVAELVAGGWLSSPPALPGYELTLESTIGRPTGRILVNGQPADQGCAAEPPPGP